MTCFAFWLYVPGRYVCYEDGSDRTCFEIWFLYPVSMCFEDVSARTCLVF